jgi:hypothetical protein
MKTVTPDNYKEDPLYRRVVNAVRHLQENKGEVTPINVLLTLGMLTPAKLQEWERGEILFLEAVLHSNLSKTNRILRILRLHARDLDMRAVETDYTRVGPGPRRVLKFTKSGDPNIERAYARVYLAPGR